MPTVPEHVNPSANASVDAAEIAKFSAMAEEWWHPHGKFKPLHQFNPTRIAHLKAAMCRHFGRDETSITPFTGLRVLDIGCGGGLLAEPFTRLGASVTAIDASEKNIKIASLHAEKMGLAIDYRATTIEALAASGAQFDMVLNMEVIEHVANVESFMQAACAVVKPGGMMSIATMNRTRKAYLMAIIGAEVVLRWLPRGTHDWQKFLKPSEIEAHLRAGGLHLHALDGMVYSPITQQWRVSEDVSVNYVMLGVKPLPC